MNLVYPIAKVVIVFLALSYNGCSTFVQGFPGTFQNNSGDDTKLIANQLLFRNESTNIHYQISIPEEEEPPLMMMSVRLVKTLDRDIVPDIVHIYRSFHEKKPVLDLSAANESEHVILTPSTSAFTIDTSTGTLTAVLSPFMVPLYPYNEGDNESNHTIAIVFASVNGTTEYFIDFALSVNSTDMEGLYKFYLHTSGSVRTKFYTPPSTENNYEKMDFVNAVFYMIIVLAVFRHIAIKSIRPVVKHYCGDDGKQQLLLVTVWFVYIEVCYCLISIVHSELYCAGMGFFYLIRFVVLAAYSLSYSTWQHLNWTWKIGKQPLHWILKDILHYVIISSIMVFVLLQSFNETDIYVIIKATIFIYLLVHSRQLLIKIETEKTRLDNLRKEANPTKEIQKKIERIQENGKELFKLHFFFLWFCILYTFAIPFNLTLAIMTWLRVPYHLFWLPPMIEDVLQLCFLLSLEKVINAWNGFEVKHRKPAPKSINYSKRNIVSFVLLGKCFGCNKRIRSDNQNIRYITNVSRRSARDRIEIAFWLILRTDSLQFWTVFMLSAIFINCNIRAIINLYF